MVKSLIILTTSSTRPPAASSTAIRLSKERSTWRLKSLGPSSVIPIWSVTIYRSALATRIFIRQGASVCFHRSHHPETGHNDSRPARMILWAWRGISSAGSATTRRVVAAVTLRALPPGAVETELYRLRCTTISILPCSP